MTAPAARRRIGFHDILVVIASGCLVLDGVHFPGTQFPVSTVCAGILVVLAYFRRPSMGRRPAWVVAALACFVIWLGIASALNTGIGGIDIKRFLNIALWAALAATVASGRLWLRMIGVGLSLGVVFAVGWGLATIGSSSYVGRMTGVLGDPNTAGLIILTFTCLAVPQLQHRRTQVALVTVGVVGIVATFSRTTWLATACVVAWILLGKHISRWVGLAAVSGLIWWSTSQGDKVLASSQFSERAGSDALRGRIVAAEQVLVNESPITGHGLGSAHVDVDTLTFFFHSSYLSLRQEGGWIALLLYLAMIAVLFLSLTSQPKVRRSSWAEAVLIGILICAVNLGEVFLTVPAALAIGIASTHLVRRAKRLPAQTPWTGQWRLGIP